MHGQPFEEQSLPLLSSLSSPPVVDIDAMITEFDPINNNQPIDDFIEECLMVKIGETLENLYGNGSQ